MKPRLALILGVLALAGAGLWLVKQVPDSASVLVERSASSAKSKPVSKALPPGPDVVSSAPLQTPRATPEPATQPSVGNLVSLPHPATTVSPPPAAKAAPAVVVGHPDVVTPGSRQDHLADLEKVRLMLRDYRTLMGDNPVGSNAEIMKSIMGGNPKHAQLGPAGGQGINGSGELVDRWETPYFFHQMSATNMEIRSAGPDKIMWTPDDVVLR